jgi:DME family drug/metabolite transporter
VAAQSGPDGEIDVIGLVAAGSAGCGYAVYSTTSKLTIGRGLDPTAALAAPFTLGSSLLVLVALGGSWSWLAGAGGVALAMYLGVAATGVAYVLYARGLRTLPSSTAVTLVLAEPVTASLLAVIVLGEPIPPAGWLGVAIVLVGLGLTGRAAVGPTVDRRGVVVDPARPGREPT